MINTFPSNTNTSNRDEQLNSDDRSTRINPAQHITNAFTGVHTPVNSSNESSPATDPWSLDTATSEEVLETSGTNKTASWEEYTPPAAPVSPAATSTKTSSSFDNNTPTKPSLKTVGSLLVVLLLVVGSSVGIYLVRQNQEIRQQASTENAVIATVGEEKIYQSDLDTELKYFPPVSEVEGMPVEEYLLNKIVQDSKVLQATGKTNDPTIYNSPTKDYLKRTNLVQNLIMEQEGKLINENATVKGTALTMWYNNQDYGDQPVSERKAIVEKKINDLHERVANGTLTIEQAIEQVRNDSELDAIDPSHYGNAEYPFALVEEGDLINKSPAITEDARSLSPGETTGVYDFNLSANEQLFMFAVITDKQAAKSNTPKTVEQWLEKIDTQYNVQKQ